MDTEFLPLELIDANKIMRFEKWVDLENHNCSCENENPCDFKLETDGCQCLHQKICLLTADGTQYHKYCGFNKFSVETYPAPLKSEGWTDLYESVKQDYVDADIEDISLDAYMERCIESFRKRINQSVFDPTAKIFEPIPGFHEKHADCQMYKILNNYDIQFIVFVSPDGIVYVYGHTQDVVSEMYENDEYEMAMFNILILESKPLEIFIGKSVLNEMTKFSGGHGERFDGNTILLRVGETSEFRYLWIGYGIFEFTTDEVIVKFTASVGNNCVPYPYAESEKFCYCMCCGKSSVADVPDREIKGSICYRRDVTYESFDKICKNPKNYNNKLRFPEPTDEKTRIVRFDKPINCCMMANTCADPQLPAVQKLNNYLNGGC